MQLNRYDLGNLVSGSIKYTVEVIFFIHCYLLLCRQWQQIDWFGLIGVLKDWTGCALDMNSNFVVPI